MVNNRPRVICDRKIPERSRAASLTKESASCAMSPVSD